MPKSNTNEPFVIVGPEVDEEILYWSNHIGWTVLENASHFDSRILTIPLPIESTAILNLAEDKIYFQSPIR